MSIKQALISDIIAATPIRVAGRTPTRVILTATAYPAVAGCHDLAVATVTGDTTHEIVCALRDRLENDPGWPG